MKETRRWRRVKYRDRVAVHCLRRQGLRDPEIAATYDEHPTWVTRHLEKPLETDMTVCNDKTLCLRERKLICNWLFENEKYAEIGRRLDRHRSTIKREVDNNGGRENYDPEVAHQQAQQSRQRPKLRKIEASDQLRDEVEWRLKKRWSPMQIAGELAELYGRNSEMSISHEAIYKAIYIQTKGGFKADFTKYLRTNRVRRKKQGRDVSPRERFADMVMISERPPEVEDRAIPGHWEGDRIMGARNSSSLITLVERTTRFTLLISPTNTNCDAASFAKDVARHMKTLPTQLRRTLTWDQGREMAHFKQIQIDAEIEVYFCDPFGGP